MRLICGIIVVSLSCGAQALANSVNGAGVAQVSAIDPDVAVSLPPAPERLSDGAKVVEIKSAGPVLLPKASVWNFADKGIAVRIPQEEIANKRALSSTKVVPTGIKRVGKRQSLGKAIGFIPDSIRKDTSIEPVELNSIKGDKHLAAIEPLLDDNKIDPAVEQFVADGNPIVQFQETKSELYVSKNDDGSVNTKIKGRVRAVKDIMPSSPLTGVSDSVIQDRGVSVGGLTEVMPRKVTDFDPFNTVIRWDWSGINVWTAVERIAKYAGYRLIVDPEVQDVYEMPLPGSHRVVSGVNARTGLELLGGPAFTVVVDHQDRTVSHMLKPMYVRDDADQVLPKCPDDTGFATLASGGSGVWVVGGRKCTYR